MTVEVGDDLPTLTVESVDGGRMKTMAALLHDPYPIHWDPAVVADLGLGDRLINQGPLSLGYITNMLMAWQGPDCILRLKSGFRAPVFSGDRVTAGGQVRDVVEEEGEVRAVCDIWLDTETARAIDGVATVRLSNESR